MQLVEDVGVESLLYSQTKAGGVNRWFGLQDFPGLNLQLAVGKKVMWAHTAGEVYGLGLEVA